MRWSGYITHKIAASRNTESSCITCKRPVCELWLQPGAHPTSARSLKSWKRVTRCGAHLRPCSPAWRKHIMQQKTRTKHRRAHRNAPHSCLRSLRFRRTSVKPFVLKRIKKNPRTLKLLRYPPPVYIYVHVKGTPGDLNPSMPGYAQTLVSFDAH